MPVAAGFGPPRGVPGRASRSASSGAVSPLHRTGNGARSITQGRHQVVRRGSSSSAWPPVPRVGRGAGSIAGRVPSTPLDRSLSRSGRWRLGRASSRSAWAARMLCPAWGLVPRVRRAVTRSWLGSPTSADGRVVPRPAPSGSTARVADGVARTPTVSAAAYLHRYALFGFALPTPPEDILMAHVRGHYRSDGTYVRPHYRRTRPATARTASARSPRRVNAVRPQSTPAVPMTRVRSYYRADGTYVRSHHRRISPPVAVAAGGGGVVLFILLVLALLGGGGSGAKSTPSQHPSSPISLSGHLSHR